jgi:DMSO reductase family type II enzyme chaperone
VGAEAAVRDGAAAARALARSGIYRALAEAFRYPLGEDARAFERTLDRAREGAAGVVGPEVAAALAALAEAARGATPERRREEHVATFGHVTLPDCPLYETACGPTDAFRQPQTLADLNGFYRAFGVEVAAGAGERGDHLAVELEFMHYLAYREAYALEHHGDAEVGLIRDAQRRFLEAHLGRWAPAVARAVAARAGGLSRAAAALLERFLAEELLRWP